MGVYSYNDVPAELVPFSLPTLELIRNEPRISVFDFKRDVACVLDRTAPEKGFIGTVQDAFDASIGTFARAGNAGVTGADGKISYVGTNVWRRQFDPITHEPLGYLPEQQRTNLCLYSEAFFSPNWSVARGTVTSDQALAPDAMMTADLFVESTEAGAHGPFKSNFDSVTAGTTYTFSIFAKKRDANRHIILSIDGAGAGTGGNAAYDLDTGARLTTGGAVVVSSGAQQWGNGWWRIHLTVTASATGTVRLLCLLFNSTGMTLSYAGDGTSGVFLWGAQFEVGGYPTSYIPTEGSAVTRNADVMTVPLTKLPFSVSAGTLLATLQPTADQGANTSTWASIRKDSNDRFLFRNGAAGMKSLRIDVISAGATVAAIQSGSNSAADRSKAAVGWAADDFEFVVDGVSAGVDTAGALPSGLLDLNIGHSGGGFDWGAPIESMILIPRRLTQSEMIARTAA